MLTPKERTPAGRTAVEQKRFDAYLSGDLSPKEAESLEDALAADEELLAAFEAYAADEDVVRQRMNYSPPPQFTDHVRNRIRRRSGGRFFQEDVVIKKYLPRFIVLAVAVLAVVYFFARPSGEMSEEDIQLLEQGAVEDANAEDADKRGRRVSDRSNRRTPSAEEYMKPASQNRRYQDLPVSGGRTPDSVTYTRRVFTLKSSKSADELRKEIDEVFGSVTLEEADGYLRLQIRDKDLSGARQRLDKLDGEVTYESTKVPSDEAKERYLRFYYDTSSSGD